MSVDDVLNGSVEIVCLPRGKPKPDGSTWCFEGDEVLSWDVHVWKADGVVRAIGYETLDEVRNLPCGRSMELIASYFAARYGVTEYDIDWRCDEAA